jgi:hypothetical protein
MKLESITLNDQSKPVVHPDSLNELKEAWQLLGFANEQPAIVIVGGAGGMTEEGVARAQAFFENHLIPFAVKKNAVIIEGGTDSGVMAAIGRARNLTGANFPLVGVLARDIDMIGIMLEPHHTHFIFCPGSNWGDESEWIAASASALSGSQPTIAILINGGQIAWEDARLNIEYGRPVLIAEGSGRTADVIATTSTGKILDRQALSLLRTGKVHIANFFKEPERFIEKLSDLMK